MENTRNFGELSHNAGTVVVAQFAVFATARKKILKFRLVALELDSVAATLSFRPGDEAKGPIPRWQALRALGVGGVILISLHAFSHGDARGGTF